MYHRMTKKMYVISGTDTNVGKTMVSLMLALALPADYWKPIQAGLDEETDSAYVRRIVGSEAVQVFPEAYCLKKPASPHLAALVENIQINEKLLDFQVIEGLREMMINKILLIEGAGGVMVPLDQKTLLIDIFSKWQIPVIVCARAGLGTINHSLLTLEALQKRNIPIHGLIFIGDSDTQESSMRYITERTHVKILGRLPHLEKINKEILVSEFAKNFHIKDFI